MKCSKCGEPVSLWKRDLSKGLCPTCLTAEKAAAQKAIEEHANEFRHRQIHRNCTHCQSEAIVDGTMSGTKLSLRLGSLSSWLFPHEIRIVVCLDCGHIGQYVSYDVAFSNAKAQMTIRPDSND